MQRQTLVLFLIFSLTDCFLVKKSRLPLTAFSFASSSTSSIVEPRVELPQTHPSPPHTFSGAVEAGIQQKFKNADRVVESWRLMEVEYKHKVFVGSDDSSKDNKMLFQECHSYVPGLKIQPFWDVDSFDWAKKLKSKHSIIRKELLEATANIEKLKEDGNNVWAGALSEDASSYGAGWKTLVLMDRGVWDPVNVGLFPKTAKAVKASGIPAVEVFFASMEPNSRIQPHSDFTNFVLTSHLAVEIPESGKNRCRLSVASETREWINGEMLLFDTSLMHDAVNESDQTRYILMFRIWHPDLSEQEQKALQYIYDCLNLPEIVTGDTPDERARMLDMMEQARGFPSLRKKSQGFGMGGGADSIKKGKKGKR